jgi:hypothetical protein
MWVYTTLAHVVKEATRYTVVHGADCAQANSSCPVTVGQIATRIQQAGVGLDPGQLNVVLQSAGTTQNCLPLKSCLSGSAQFPPSPDNQVGQPVAVSVTYPFNSTLAMFIPQAGAVQFNAFNFTAKSQEEMQY